MDWSRAKLTINLQVTLRVTNKWLHPIMNAVGKRIWSAICGSTHRGVASIKFTDQPLVQRWIKALQLAPCLECGEPTPSSRVDCSRSGFPLTCSSVLIAYRSEYRICCWQLLVWVGMRVLCAVIATRCCGRFSYCSWRHLVYTITWCGNTTPERYSPLEWNRWSLLFLLPLVLWTSSE